MRLDDRSIVEVDGEGVFTAQWTMQQMQALMDMYKWQKARTYICMVLTAVSVLVSLVAIVT